MRLVNLDLRRVNSPTRNISRNIVIGSVNLKLETSLQLQEKTNREGFVVNAAFRHLKQMVLGALAVFETERQIDKRKQLSTGKPTEGVAGGITKPIEQLRQLARHHGVAAGTALPSSGSRPIMPRCARTSSGRVSRMSDSPLSSMRWNAASVFCTGASTRRAGT